MMRPSAWILGLGVLVAGCSRAPSEDAPAERLGRAQLGAMLPGLLGGTIRAVATESCAWTVNGTEQGTSKVLDVAVFPATYTVTCTAANNAHVSTTVSVGQGETKIVTLAVPSSAPPPSSGSSGHGTLVAVAVGGSCTFAVNGAAKGTSSQLKLSIPPGTYSVSCRPSSGGAQKTRSVILKPGETAMAMFKLS